MRRLIATLAVLGATTAVVFAAPVRPLPGAITEGTRYDCPDIVEAAPQTVFFDTPVYQGEDGWFFRADADVSDFTQQAPQILDMFARFSDVLKQRGVGFVYVPVPNRGMGSANRLPKGLDDGVLYDSELASSQYKAMVSQFRKRGVTTVDLLSTIEVSDLPAFFYARDIHWRPEGARLAASAIATSIEAAGYLRGVKRSAFRSVSEGDAALSSTTGRALQELCRDVLDPQDYTVWKTTKSDVTADDLLGGDDEGGDTAPIALVGTSFSQVLSFNFAGFLTESTGVDVANWAVANGGTYTSIMDWSHSSMLDAVLPKVLVWENPVGFRLNSGGVLALRQIIPALRGGCAGSAVLSTKLTVEPGKPATVAIDDDVRLSGHDAWLDMRLSDATLRNFTISLETRDGDGEDFTISRLPRMANTDRAFLELNDDLTAPLATITIAAPVSAATEFTLDVCKEKGA